MVKKSGIILSQQVLPLLLQELQELKMPLLILLLYPLLK